MSEGQNESGVASLPLIRARVPFQRPSFHNAKMSCHLRCLSRKSNLHSANREIISDGTKDFQRGVVRMDQHASSMMSRHKTVLDVVIGDSICPIVAVATLNRSPARRNAERDWESERI